MTEFQPWTIENGTLQLNPWPEHSGRVVVTVDVFDDWHGPVADERGWLLHRTTDGWCSTGNFDAKRAVRIADVLQALFAHIDANPQATYHLRTLHPERVADEWGERFDPNCKACGGDGCDSEPWRASDLMAPSPCRKCFHRPNVAIAAGPIRTQAEADRLLPELMQLSDLCREVYPVFRPVERIQFPLPCRDSVFWSAVPRIVVSGGPEPMHPDNVRDLRDQAEAAGVPFVFLGWGDWLHMMQFGCGEHDLRGVELRGPINAFMARVGSENSGCELDDKTYPWKSEGANG